MFACPKYSYLLEPVSQSHGALCTLGHEDCGKGVQSSADSGNTVQLFALANRVFATSLLMPGD